MTVTENAQNARALGRKPTDDQIDVHGLTHAGLVRNENQDHFLVSSLHRRMEVHLTSVASLIECRIEPSELDPCVGCGELPIDACALVVSE